MQHRGALDHEKGKLKEGIDKATEAAIRTADKTQEVGFPDRVCCRVGRRIRGM
jgi:hypothetical protein